MNKTIIININGIVFHIEEDAYEVLKSYMTEVKRHFAYSKDSDEIVTDIENRLAEMFSQKLTDHNKQVIVLADVEEITAQMGKPSDFDTVEEDAERTFDWRSFKTNRVLYRDSDDKIIGGVCAGLGHYFDIEAKWIRLIAIILIFTSIGIVAYLILWIILPTATSRKDKISMRGEPINLHTFKKSFDEEAESFNEGGQAFQNVRAVNKASDPVQDILNFIGKCLKVALKVIGGIIITIGGILLFALIAGFLFALGFLNNTDYQQFPLNAINQEYRSPVFFSAFLLLIIPLVALILFAIRVLLNRKIVSRYGSFAMLILWLTGISMGIYYGSKIAVEFKEEATIEQIQDLQAYPALTLKLNRNLFFTQEDSVKYNITSGKGSGRIMYGKNNIDSRAVQNFNLYIEKSDDDKLSIVKELSGKGKNFEDALNAAQHIGYQLLQKDSVIQFDKYFSLTGNGLFRDQKLNIHLKVPVNTRLLIYGNLNSNLRKYNLWYCQPPENNSDEISEWIMTENGLECADQALYDKKKNRD